MLTLVRRHRRNARARFAPRSSRLAPRPPSGSLCSPPALPFGVRVPGRCTALRESASATAPPSAHCRSQCSRHSCGRSCGARPHFARHCLAQCAPHRQPLNRRGGSDPPGPPTSIFRSFIQRESTIRPAGPALGSTPDAAGCWACHRAPCHAFFGPFGVKQRPEIVGPSVCSGTVSLDRCNYLIFSDRVSWSIQPDSPEHTPALPRFRASSPLLTSRTRSISVPESGSSELLRASPLPGIGLRFILGYP